MPVTCAALRKPHKVGDSPQGIQQITNFSEKAIPLQVCKLQKRKRISIKSQIQLFCYMTSINFAKLLADERKKAREQLAQQKSEPKNSLPVLSLSHIVSFLLSPFPFLHPISPFPFLHLPYFPFPFYTFHLPFPFSPPLHSLLRPFAPLAPFTPFSSILLLLLHSPTLPFANVYMYY
jgi:hypothetical protein